MTFIDIEEIVLVNSYDFSSRNEIDLINIVNTQSKPVIVWSGAGLSAPAGLPTWQGLRDMLESELEKRRVFEKIRKVKELSHWEAFDFLESELGRATFEGVIRGVLESSNEVTPPSVYEKLWSIGIKGMITLNIDSFAKRSFKNSNNNCLLIDRDGFNVKSLIGELTKANTKILASLHGNLESSESWVFGSRSLSNLLSDSHYNEFVRDCIKYATIIFVGITATDKAIIEHFKRVTVDIGSSGPHFWITSNTENELLSEAESASIRVVQYDSANGHGYIEGLVDWILNPKKSNLSEVNPVLPLGRSSVSDGLLCMDDLNGASPNKVRRILNSAAVSILNDGSSDSMGRFVEFCKKNAIHIHAANYLDADVSLDADEVLGYKISNQEKEGGFAKVWRGYDASGNQYAIKLFRHEIRQQPSLLSAFRRGIRSMRMLDSRHVDGVVKFVDAAEIPPVVIMEWVEGVTLHEAVKQGGLRDLNSIVRVMFELSDIIFRSHSTPEGVIHRDLRPQNIMLRDYYTEKESSEVVVLDFDLSWHEGASEKSVYISGGTAYLAPEQLNDTGEQIARSATVDSFAFGMIFYFMLTGTDPQFFVHINDDWERRVKLACGSKKIQSWLSSRKMIENLILQSTKHEPSKRMLFAQIHMEMKRIYNAINNPEKVHDATMIIEEVMCRTDSLHAYHKNGDFVEYTSPTGLNYRIKPCRDDDFIKIIISFTQTGNENFKNFVHIKSMISEIDQDFRGFEVRNVQKEFEMRSFRIELDLKIADCEDVLLKLSSSIEKVHTKLSSLLSR